MEGIYFTKLCGLEAHSSFGAIADRYIQYITAHYGSNVTVVFDGYPVDAVQKSTKSSERLRKAKLHSSREITVDEKTMAKVPQQKFLSNDKNKIRFIKLMTTKMGNLNIQVLQAEEDADRVIITTGSGCQSLGDFDPVSPRRPSVTLMKWAVGGGKRKPSGRTESIATETATPSASRQVSFCSTSKQHQEQQTHQQQPSIVTLPKEPISLATLNRDCFIIPVASLHRFLPAGVPMPLTENSPSFLNVLEVDDPKLCVIMHLMSPLEPIDPILESPLIKPIIQQKTAASDLLTEIGSAKTAMEGMLFSNMEKNAEFPFISYYVINKNQTDPVEFFHKLQAASLRKFDPRNTRYTAVHTLDLFNEVATIARPPLDPSSKRPHTTTTGYIISVYKVFEGDDGEKFEKNWLYWTGARMLYRYLPKSVGMRRITLHKSISGGDKMYLLLCECSNFLGNLQAAALLLPALRARLCGYTGLYRTTASF